MGEITIPDALGRGMKLAAMPRHIVIIGKALFMIADAAYLFTGAGRCPPTGSGPTWEPRRYWRGLVWIIVNWFLMEGLQRYGYDDLAGIIRQNTLSLVETNGFREYYDARDGSGCGSVNSSWSASLILELLMAPPAQENKSHRAARQLRRQKTETIGFILPSISKRFSEPFFTEFISGLGEQLSHNNFDLLISNAATDDAERNLYQRWVSSRKVDGFILSRIRKHNWRVNFLSQWDIPFVTLGKSHDAIGYSCVRVDAAGAYLELVQQIQRNGFPRFAFVGGPNDLMNHIDRLKWFKAALKKCGLEVDPKNVVSIDMSSTGGYEAACQLLSSPTPPDAILAVNDETALGVLHATHEQGFRVGTDIAIVGFDGIQDALHTEPPLTTLGIPVAGMACQLVDMLLENIGNTSLAAREIVVQPELLSRASTGPWDAFRDSDL